MKKKIIGIICVLALVAGVIGFFYMRSRSTNQEGVFVTSISEMNNISYMSTRYSGIVEAEKTVDYKQNSDQTIEEIYVEEGDMVIVEQPLFKYNVQEIQNRMTSLQIDIDELTARNQQVQGYINAGGLSTIEVQQYQLQIRQNNYDIQTKQVTYQQYQTQVDNAVVKSTINGTVKAVNDPSEQTDSTKPIISETDPKSWTTD